MSTPTQANLLRRTTLALASVAGLLIAADSTAANVKLNGGSGNSCDYSSMTVTPDGGITVQCAGTTAPTNTTPNNPTNPSPPPPPPPPTPPPVTTTATSACPTGFTPPTDMLKATLGGFGNPLFQLQKSQQVVSIPLPVTNFNTGVISIGESAGGAYTPQPVVLEYSINKCPGLILPVVDTDGKSQYCNGKSSVGNVNSITWFSRPYSVIKDETTANRYAAACWAGDAEPYYFNARWTYNVCAFGASVCGFSIQHNQGPY